MANWCDQCACVRILMENEADLGVRLVSTLRLEARYIHTLATEAQDGHSVGLGLSYTF